MGGFGKGAGVDAGPAYDGFRLFLDVRDNRMDTLTVRHMDECGGCPRRCSYDKDGRGYCPLVQWENAAASFRYRAHNVDLAGRRDVRKMIDEATGDARLPSDFRDELRRQYKAEVQRRAGGNLDDRLLDQNWGPGAKETE